MLCTKPKVNFEQCDKQGGNSQGHHHFSGPPNFFEGFLPFSGIFSKPNFVIFHVHWFSDFFSLLLLIVARRRRKFLKSVSSHSLVYIRTSAAGNFFRN